jgi:FKBP-type peptidyl-prolyl cis-trans isomerase
MNYNILKSYYWHLTMNKTLKTTILAVTISLLTLVITKNTQASLSEKATKSGIVYQTLEKGSGEQPNVNDFITVIYEGYLQDGTMFDSSNGKEITLQLNRTIQGWQEGIKLMRPGSVYSFLIPPHLAYGSRGTSGIPPNASLIFKVKLIRTRKAGLI